jgi:cyclic-di-GMP phosphodiesterase, flagellum assembly factor TipF
MRLGNIFIVICMAIIAASAGAVAYLYLGMDRAAAIAIAVAALAALALSGSLSTRIGIRSVVGRQLADLAGGTADLARQVAEMGRRLAAMERKVESAVDRAHAATDPLAVEIDELGALVKRLAETVAAHQTALADLTRPPVLPFPRQAAAAPVPEPEAEAPKPVAEVPKRVAEAEPPAAIVVEPPPEPKVATIDSGGFKGLTNDEALAVIRSAAEANHLDLYLQPIVTLPQRKVRFYEAMSRLRSERGDAFPAADFIALAEDGGLMPKIDSLVLFRCVQVVRRLLLKNREIGVFCNLSAATLTDSASFPQFLDFMDANRAIAPSLVLEFPQSALRNIGPIENEGLAALSERGFRFSLDNVTDLRLEPRELANRGFRFIKIPASLLLNRGPATPADIHPSDLSDLLGRFGIDLIADKIENEGSVVDLLDCDVRFGQGFLFSPPRPVRAEALQGIDERGDLIARESAPAPAGNPAATAQAPAKGSPPDANKEVRPTGLAQLARNVANRH